MACVPVMIDWLFIKRYNVSFKGAIKTVVLNQIGPSDIRLTGICYFEPLSAHGREDCGDEAMKINVVGTSGAGKSTLARRLSRALSLPHIEMDALLFLPGWQEKPDEQFLAALEAAMAVSNGWVMDGNFDRTRAVKWRDVDMVVWVDIGFWRTMTQAVCRALRRAWTRQELWPGTGNRESFRKTFLSRDSILLWTLKAWPRNRRRYVAAMTDPQYRHIRFVRLCNTREIDALVQAIGDWPDKESKAVAG